MPLRHVTPACLLAPVSDTTGPIALNLDDGYAYQTTKASELTAGFARTDPVLAAELPLGACRDGIRAGAGMTRCRAPRPHLVCMCSLGADRTHRGR